MPFPSLVMPASSFFIPSALLFHSRERGNPWPDLSEKRMALAEAQRPQSSLSAPLRLCVNNKWRKLECQTMDSRLRGNDNIGVLGLAL
jgi:hypothetical protein